MAINRNFGKEVRPNMTDQVPTRSSERRCVACATRDAHPLITLREMYFGTQEEFPYFVCVQCETIQIVDIPEDIGRHYRGDYYSYSPAKPRSEHPLVRKLRAQRTRSWLGNRDPIGKLLAALSSRRPDYLDWFSGLDLDTGAEVLDVGCGSGQLLLKMQRDGFSRLRGADPFIEHELKYENGLSIDKTGIENVAGSWDIIMFHHSLEHMSDPLAALQAAKRILKPQGRILIRVPLTGGYAWRKYGRHWYALDAPRHLFIPSLRGMHCLSKRADLAIDRRFYDSDAGQFLASESYMRDIPLVDQMRRPAEVDPQRRAHINQFVDALNATGDGDCAGFLLRHKE